MSEIRKATKKPLPRRISERDWNDRIDGDERDTDEHESTYRDGSAKNECWNDHSPW